MNDAPAAAATESGRARLATAAPRRSADDAAPVKLSVRGLDFHYGKFHAI